MPVLTCPVKLAMNTDEVDPCSSAVRASAEADIAENFYDLRRG